MPGRCPGQRLASAPFFSPDGEWVGFFDMQDMALKKVSIRGGPPLTLCEAPNDRGGSWGADDTIVFVSSGGAGVLPTLFRVAGTGGTPSVLLSSEDLNYGSLAWPEILPSNKAVLLSLAPLGGIFTQGRVGVLSLETGQIETVMEHGYYARYAPSGHLVFLLGGALMAVPFDLDRLAATGPPSPLVENVLTNPVTGASSFAFSQEGSLAFVSGGATVTENTLLWVDRRGASRPITGERRAYLTPRLSPDGRRLAVTVYDENIARGHLDPRLGTRCLDAAYVR